MPKSRRAKSQTRHARFAHKAFEHQNDAIQALLNVIDIGAGPHPDTHALDDAVHASESENSALERSIAVRPLDRLVSVGYPVPLVGAHSFGDTNNVNQAMRKLTVASMKLKPLQNAIAYLLQRGMVPNSNAYRGFMSVSAECLKEEVLRDPVMTCLVHHMANHAQPITAQMYLTNRRKRKNDQGKARAQHVAVTVHEVEAIEQRQEGSEAEEDSTKVAEEQTADAGEGGEKKSDIEEPRELNVKVRQDTLATSLMRSLLYPAQMYNPPMSSILHEQELWQPQSKTEEQLKAELMFGFVKPGQAPTATYLTTDDLFPSSKQLQYCGNRNDGNLYLRDMSTVIIDPFMHNSMGDALISLQDPRAAYLFARIAGYPERLRKQVYGMDIHPILGQGYVTNNFFVDPIVEIQASRRNVGVPMVEDVLMLLDAMINDYNCPSGTPADVQLRDKQFDANVRMIINTAENEKRHLERHMKTHQEKQASSSDVGGAGQDSVDTESSAHRASVIDVTASDSSTTASPLTVQQPAAEVPVREAQLTKP